MRYLLWLVSLCLWAQEDVLILDALGHPVAARPGNYGFLTRFSPDGKRVDWTIVPPGGARSVIRGPGQSLLVASADALVEVSLNGAVGRRIPLPFPCASSPFIEALLFTSRQSVWISGQAPCLFSALGGATAQGTLSPTGFSGELDLSTGEWRWLAPRVNGTLLHEARDGSLWLAGPQAIVHLSSDGRSILAQQPINAAGAYEARLLEVLPDGRVLLAGAEAGAASLLVFRARLESLIVQKFLFPNGTRFLGGRIHGEEIQLIGYADSPPPSTTLRSRACGGGNFQLRMNLIGGSLLDADWLPAQRRVSGLTFRPNSPTFLTTSDSRVNWVYPHDLEKPDPGYCFFFSSNGQLADLRWSERYYTVFFPTPRPPAEILINDRPVERIYSSPTQINFRTPAFSFLNKISVDGEPLPYVAGARPTPVFLFQDPFGPSLDKELLAVDSQGRPITRSNPVGPGDRITLFLERGSFWVAQLFLRAEPDEFRPFTWNFGYFQQGQPIDSFPNIDALTIEFPQLDPTPTPRRCRGAGGYLWCAIQYPEK